MKVLALTLALCIVAASSLPRRASRSRYTPPNSRNNYDSIDKIVPRFPYNPLNYVRTKTDDRIHTDAYGTYNFDIETENNIIMSEAGQAKGGSSESIVKAGSYSFTLPDGNLFEMKYVADENGFQPESSYLPVAPVFPHPIPQFVLDQIAFAAREDAEREAKGYKKTYQ